MQKAPITTRAVIQRINRKLKPGMRCVRVCRPNSRWWNNLGDFYVVDFDANIILDSHIDPEAYGRDLGVVKPFEQVVADDAPVIGAAQ